MTTLCTIHYDRMKKRERWQFRKGYCTAAPKATSISDAKLDLYLSRHAVDVEVYTADPLVEQFGKPWALGHAFAKKEVSLS